MTGRMMWDCYDAYLFDIDGTLLHCTDAVHYFAFCDALTAITGFPMNLDGVVAHGNVDTGILRDALIRSGLPAHVWGPRLEEAREAMRRQVERNKADLRVEPTQHAAEMLQYLRAQGAKLGVATGNLEAIGRLKLSHCGLLHYFDFAGWSDDFEYRKDVFAHALKKSRDIAGPGARVCVVGDTPADVKAAHANGLDVIAVATGIYSHDQLTCEGPTWCINSFDDLLRMPVTARN
jgi:phosphoglycolate phosphatase-like HAD superfamily hydrolase